MNGRARQVIRCNKYLRFSRIGEVLYDSNRRSSLRSKFAILSKGLAAKADVGREGVAVLYNWH